MIDTTATHLRRDELPNAAVNIVLLILAAVIAEGRFGR
jgi:hypothetical protein